MSKQNKEWAVLVFAIFITVGSALTIYEGLVYWTETTVLTVPYKKTVK